MRIAELVALAPMSVLAVVWLIAQIRDWPE